MNWWWALPPTVRWAPIRKRRCQWVDWWCSGGTIGDAGIKHHAVAANVNQNHPLDDAEAHLQKLYGHQNLSWRRSNDKVQLVTIILCKVATGSLFLANPVLAPQVIPRSPHLTPTVGKKFWHSSSFWYALIFALFVPSCYNICIFRTSFQMPSTCSHFAWNL